MIVLLDSSLRVDTVSISTSVIKENVLEFSGFVWINLETLRSISNLLDSNPFQNIEILYSCNAVFNVKNILIMSE